MIFRIKLFMDLRRPCGLSQEHGKGNNMIQVSITAYFTESAATACSRASVAKNPIIALSLYQEALVSIHLAQCCRGVGKAHLSELKDIERQIHFEVMKRIKL